MATTEAPEATRPATNVSGDGYSGQPDLSFSSRDRRVDVPVFESTNYDQFKFKETNREIDEGHVRKIKSSIEKNGYLPYLLVIVSADGFIIEGQHRLKAAKAAGEPFCYHNTGRPYDEALVKDLNTSQKNWEMMDFVRAYAKGGNENYIRLRNLMEAYDLPPTAASATCSKGTGSDRRKVKAGTFKTPEDMSHPRRIADIIVEIRKINSAMIAHNKQHIGAIKRILHEPEVTPDELIRKMKLYDKTNEYEHKGTSGRDWLRQIYDVYSHGRRLENQIRSPR